MKSPIQILVLMCSVMIAACSPWWGDESVPPDDAMIARYRDNRTDLASLLAIVQECPRPFVFRVDSDYQQDVGLSPEQWHAAIGLMKKIGCQSVRAPVNNVGRVYCFGFASFGNVSGGWYKGIAFSYDRPKRTFDTLDQAPPNAGRMEMLLRDIDSGWYVFLQIGG